MNRSFQSRSLVAAFLACGALSISTGAFAQAPPLNESIVIGAWTFRPSLEVRIRGEARTDPFGFDRTLIFGGEAVHWDAPNSNLPPSFRVLSTPVPQGWLVAERTRLGLAVDRGPVTAMLKLQDARALAGTSATGGFLQFGATGPTAGISPYEVYIDVHSQSGRQMFLRLGRQAVKWGDGRLIGTNDFTPTGRSLDAARFGVEVGDFDVEALVAVLGLTGSGLSGTAAGGLGSLGDEYDFLGAQLYGLKVTGHFLPLLQAEAVGLARVVRSELNPMLAPGNTYVGDLRLFGNYRGFSYSLEGAYQGGEVATYDATVVSRAIEAMAFAGRVEWETALPWHLTFGAQGAYATGDQGTGAVTDKMTRFDPILPDQTINHSRMSLYGWSNLIEFGGDIGAQPMDELRLGVGYRFVGLADPKGRWITGALTTVGADPDNDQMMLGQEIDATIRVSPWDPVSFEAGYGAFLLGDGGKNILAKAGRSAVEMQHWGYLQATVRAP
ncbi:MAG: alginate export family protein [Polyangiaceae bacterium]|nr:alginate export family protein [Polyangiaceae bacterium]